MPRPSRGPAFGAAYRDVGSGGTLKGPIIRTSLRGIRTSLRVHSHESAVLRGERSPDFQKEAPEMKQDRRITTIPGC